MNLERRRRQRTSAQLVITRHSHGCLTKKMQESALSKNAPSDPLTRSIRSSNCRPQQCRRL
eukprot:1038960-Pleurochrysis_carterae.AAC.1